MTAQTTIVIIQNKKGLHARAAAKFVKCVNQFEATVMVTRLGEPPESLADEELEWTVRGGSILGLMMLGAEPGVELSIEADGADAQDTLDAITQLVNSKFDEGE